MPSSSRAEHNLMEAAMHNPEVAKRKGISQATAADFVHADKGRDLSKLPAHVAGPHKEPDADQRGGRSDNDADDTRKAPRHIGSHDMPTKCPPKQHGDCNMPTHVPGPRQGQRRGY